jgi:hypothetical protein
LRHRPTETSREGGEEQKIMKSEALAKSKFDFSLGDRTRSGIHGKTRNLGSKPRIYPQSRARALELAPLRRLLFATDSHFLVGFGGGHLHSRGLLGGSSGGEADSETGGFQLGGLGGEADGAAGGASGNLFGGPSVVVLGAGDCVPVDNSELTVGALEGVGVDLRRRDASGTEDAVKKEIAVHGLDNNVGDLVRLELNVGEVAGTTALLGAGETQVGDVAELAKEATHGVLIETVGNAGKENYTGVLLARGNCGGKSGDVDDRSGESLLGRLVGSAAVSEKGKK